MVNLLDLTPAPVASSESADERAAHEARHVTVLTDRAAEEVLRSGQPFVLPAMTGDERGIVVGRLRWRSGLVTLSEGAGPERHVVILPI